jgi:hypothetical protein
MDTLPAVLFGLFANIPGNRRRKSPDSGLRTWRQPSAAGPLTVSRCKPTG